MKKYIISSNSNFLVVSNNKQFEVCKNKSIQVETLQNATMFAYPLNQQPNSISYTLNLQNSTTCNHIKVFTCKNCTHLFLQPFFVCTNTIIQQQTVVINNQTFIVTLFSNHLQISSSNFFETHKTNCTSFETHTHTNIIICTLKENNKTTQIIAINTQRNTSICKNATSFEIEEKTLKLQTELNTYFGHINIFNIETETMQTLHTDVYIKNQKQITNSKITPYVFLQCIQAQDYKNAICLCSENLKQQLSTEKLQAYFGEIETILQTDNYYEFVVATKNKTTTYAFELQNNQICEVQDF